MATWWPNVESLQILYSIFIPEDDDSEETNLQPSHPVLIVSITYGTAKLSTSSDNQLDCSTDKILYDN